MKLQIRERTWEVGGSAEEIFQKIEDILDEKNLFLNHIQINETEVYDDFVEAIKEYRGEIKAITVFALTLPEVMAALSQEAAEKVRALAERMEKTADDFYSINRTGNPKEDLIAYLEPLDEIRLSLQNLEAVGACRQEAMNLFLQGILVYNRMEQAIQDSDSVYLADLLHFELVPLLMQLEKELEAVYE